LKLREQQRLGVQAWESGQGRLKPVRSEDPWGLKFRPRKIL